MIELAKGIEHSLQHDDILWLLSNRPKHQVLAFWREIVEQHDDSIDENSERAWFRILRASCKVELELIEACYVREEIFYATNGRNIERRSMLRKVLVIEG